MSDEECGRRLAVVHDISGERTACFDVAASLRKLADAIDAGEYGTCHNVAWVVDCGDGEIRLGLLGKAGSPDAVCHLLMALGMRKIESGAESQTP